MKAIKNVKPFCIFKASYWYCEVRDNKTIIHIGGRTTENKTVHVIVNGYCPHSYIELPMRIAWDNNVCNNFFEYIVKTTKEGDKPIGKFNAETMMLKRELLYEKKVIFTLKL